MGVKYVFQFKRMTALEWSTSNPILNPGEPGLESDTGFLKIGLSGVGGIGLHWNDVPYQNGLGVTGDFANLTDVELTDIASDDVVQYSAGKWINRSLAEAGMAPLIHNHDDLYYTQEEVNGLISASVPAGVISQFAGTTAPTGYLLCSGQSLSKTTYPSLHSVIGYTYGGSGDTFYLPNLKGRVPVGLDSSQTEFNSLNKPGGSKVHQLSEDELPVHSHTMAHTHTFSGTTSTNGNHSHNTYATWPTAGGSNSNTGAPGDPRGNPTEDAGNHNHTFSGTTSASSAANTGNAGSNVAHNNLQPYIVLNYIIKT